MVDDVVKDIRNCTKKLRVPYIYRNDVNPHSYILNIPQERRQHKNVKNF